MVQKKSVIITEKRILLPNFFSPCSRSTYNDNLYIKI